jgi:hypothetical protein
MLLLAPEPVLPLPSLSTPPPPDAALQPRNAKHKVLPKTDDNARAIMRLR